MTDKKPAPKTKARNLSLKSLSASMNESNRAVDDRLNSVDETILEINDNVSEVLKAIQAMSAKNNPVSITKDGIDSRDVCEDLGLKDTEFTDGKNGADIELIRPRDVSIHSAEFKDKADQERFDTQMLEVLVMASQNTYPDDFASVGVNGRQLLITRGKPQLLPRNYVEVLLRAKTSTYGNIESRNAVNEIVVNNPETKAYRYPLQILRDPSAIKGAEWLARVTN